MATADRGKFQCDPKDNFCLITCDCACDIGRLLPGDPSCFENEESRRINFPTHSLPYSEETINDLARYGFYWRFDGSRLGYVECYYCDLKIEDFGVDSLAGITHLNGNPTCHLFHRENMFNNLAIPRLFSGNRPVCISQRNVNNEIRQHQIGPINEREIFIADSDLEIALLLDNPYREPSKMNERSASPPQETLYHLQNGEYNEKTRRDTYPSSWNYHMSADDLARYGFVYMSDDDRVNVNFVVYKLRTGNKKTLLLSYMPSGVHCATFSSMP